MQDMPCDSPSSQVEEFPEPVETAVHESKPVKLYSEDAVSRFTGTIDNYSHTNVNHLFGNRYRIDVWSKKTRPDHLMALFKIDKSYHAVLVDGEFVDKTIQPKYKPEKVRNIFL
jgi:hypothetical protein